MHNYYRVSSVTINRTWKI